MGEKPQQFASQCYPSSLVLSRRYPAVSKFLFQQIVLKGKDKDCVLDAEQLAAGEMFQLLEGEGLEAVASQEEEEIVAQSV